MCGNKCVSFHRDEGDTGSRHASRFTAHISNVDFTVTSSVFMLVTKVPVGPEK
jgi:hypothetical protein